MATSQNGWPVIASGTDSRLTKVAKIIGRVRAGDAATVLDYLIRRFDAEVEDVDSGADDWGYAYRPIRGKGSGYSNHASGTAVDLNATRHPLGRVGTFSASQRAAIRRILADLAGVVRWGGDYSGRKDEMHFELVGNAAQVAAVAAQIRGGKLVSRPVAGVGGTVGGVAVTPPNPIERDEDDMLMLARLKGSKQVWIGNGITRRRVKTPQEEADIRWRIQQGQLRGSADVPEVDRIDWLGVEVS